MMYEVDSWINGGNIPGKPRQFPFNMNGLGAFRDALADEKAKGFPSFKFHVRAGASA